MRVQRDLKAARKALKHSLKELDSAQADKSQLQHQVNKLSRTLQVITHTCIHVMCILFRVFYCILLILLQVKLFKFNCMLLKLNSNNLFRTLKVITYTGIHVMCILLHMCKLSD